VIDMMQEILIVPVVAIPATVIALRMLLKHADVSAERKHREKMAGLGAGQKPSPDGDARLMRVENAIESMAVELERIGEGQRFLTKLLSERSQSSDAAQRIGAGK
jgi:hypothetical protein